MNKPVFPFRYILALLTFLLTVLLYVDRACISTAKTDICNDLNLSIKQFGWIMAVFTLGYAILQTPTGIIVDKKGPRFVITLIVTIWSGLTALTGYAWNYMSMLAVRFLFGAGEAGAFPALSKVTYNWFPVKERGIVQGINFSGARIGAALALPFVAFLIGRIGWRFSFVFFGLIGIIYAVIWYFVFRNKPEEYKFMEEEEREYIIKNRQQPAASREVLPFRRIISSGNMWLAMGQYIASNFTFYFTLSWMYPYLKERFDLGGIEAGFYASVPLLAGAAGNWISGILVDWLYRKYSLTISRRVPAIAGFSLAAFGMVTMLFAETPQASILFLSVAIFGADMTLSPSWSFCIDVAGENAGAVSGTMNMAGNLGAFVTIIAFPYLLTWTGSHEVFFYVCAFLSVAAIVMWAMMKPHNPIKA
ncbi:MAG: MFS transporter [Bacteroidales bacterium]|nr:MFS transporter [Bacteroidales bacterium]